MPPETLSAANLVVYAAQLNSTVGDLAGNAAQIETHYHKAAAAGAHVALFPELMLTGYSPEDVLLRPQFVADVMVWHNRLATITHAKTALVFGSIYADTAAVTHNVDVPMPSQLKNCAVVAWGGQVHRVVFKTDLPNFGVFDEKRYFQSATSQQTFTFHNTTIGVPVCRDVWLPEVCGALRAQGAQVLLVPNASPYALHKDAQRLAVAAARVAEVQVPLLYLNLVGGQDEVVFDGKSFALNPHSTGSQTVCRFSAWQNDVQLFSFSPQQNVLMPVVPPQSSHSPLTPAAPAAMPAALPPVVTWPVANLDDECADLFAACVLGVRDYVAKNGFHKVCLGLSGGVDSALVAVIATHALGAENVHAFYMPSPYSADASAEDALELAKNLGIVCDVVPVDALMYTFATTLQPVLGTLQGLAAENIQSRIRAVLLMALSNQSGALLLTTGNKSEYATGYATIYGDMCGAFNPIKDLYKTQIYPLCQWINTHFAAPGGQAPTIPHRILTRAPSAELGPNQTDQDTLPDYPTLDAILVRAIEHKEGADAIIARGFAPAVVHHVLRLLKVSEYKRRQAAPGVKVSQQAFGREWRYPMTNAYKF